MAERTEPPEEVEQEQAAFTKALGARLRSVRHQMGLSLAQVEAMSHQQFKPSILGSYERGARTISMFRLHRLARLYGVPVEQLLPPAAPTSTEETPGQSTRAPAARQLPENTAIDLRSLREAVGPESNLLRRFVSQVQVERQDFGSRIMTLRRSDLPVIARLLGVTPEALIHQLEELGLRAES